MQLLRNKWFWVLAFAGLFGLSLDIWAWDWTEPSVLGLPYIIVYVIALETALFFMFWLFNRYYWVEHKEAGP